MVELLRRLFSKPLLCAELVVISLFINVLALAPSLYVIQLLNRYLAHGIQGTLITLTAGVLLALVFELIFRWLRQRVAAAVSRQPDHTLAMAAFDRMLKVNHHAVPHLSQGDKQEMLRGLHQIQVAYSASNIITFMDLPFSLFIVLVLYLLSPVLALVALAGLCLAVGVGFLGRAMVQGPSRLLGRAGVEQGRLIQVVTQMGDLIKGFNGQTHFTRLWENHIVSAHRVHHRVHNRWAGLLHLTGGITGLLTIAVIGTGALQVVQGSLTLGALIGANILAARALMPAVRFIALGPQLTASSHALKRVGELSRLPSTGEGRTRIKGFTGHIVFRDLAFVHPGATGPLFEGLNLDLGPGEILAVTGFNGSGKTTLAKLIIGLLTPTRGQILVDGVALTQLDMDWWRRQLIYLPQDPQFFTGTLRENLELNLLEMSEKKWNSILEQADVKAYVDTRPRGLETRVRRNGQGLPLGIRRRLALARSLCTNGQVVIFDEPTEGLDVQGQRAVYDLLNEFARRGKTLILFSHDQNILKGAGQGVDLSQKPVPGIGKRQPRARASDPVPAGSKTHDDK